MASSATTRLCEAGTGIVPELIKAPARPCHANDGHVKLATADQCLQSRKDLLVRQVARGAEKYESISAWCKSVFNVYGVCAILSLIYN